MKKPVKRLSPVQKLRKQIRHELDSMMKEVHEDLERTKNFSGPSRFSRSSDLSEKLGTILEVSERLEKKKLVPKFFVQDPR